MTIDANILYSIIESNWTDMLGLQVERIDVDRSANADYQRTIGFVHIVHMEGAWRRTVTCECSEVLAQRVAAVMFESPPEEITEDEIRDAVGEITNLIAGNLKTELTDGDGCELSLPMVVHGDDNMIDLPHTHLEAGVYCASEGQPMTVKLLTKDEKLSYASNDNPSYAKRAELADER